MSRLAILIAVALTGCSVLRPTQCPSDQQGGFGDAVEGTSCDGDGTCFVIDHFSSCASGFYRCVDGTFHYDHGIGADDGASCAESPLSSCTIEGNDCSAEPTGGECGCGSDGLWHCGYRCYGRDNATCPSAPAEGVECVPIGTSCPYTNGHHCDCVDTGIGDDIGVFQCS